MSSASLLIDGLSALLVVLGAGFALLGSWGLVRLPDFVTRLHGPTQVLTLGVGCVLGASVLVTAWQGEWAWQPVLIAVFFAMTAPVSAHRLIRAVLRAEPALRSAVPPWDPPAHPSPSPCRTAGSDGGPPG